MSEYAGSGFARFMELRGHPVFERSGVLWHEVGFRMYMSLPYYRRVDVPPSEAAKVVRSLGAAGIRYPSLEWPGLPSGLYICRRKDYGVRALHRNFRAHLRRGLPLCEVRPVTASELLSRGLEINRKTMRRQQRYDPEFGEAGRWRRFVEAIGKCPCIAAIGAFVDGRLAAYDITCFENGYLEILHKMTDFEYDDSHPSHVLDFTITSRLATDPSMLAVSMGWASLLPHPGHHEYKLRLGYDFEPWSSVIRLHPALEHTVASRPARAMVDWIRSIRGPHQTLDIAAAVLAGAASARSELGRSAAAAAMSDERTVGHAAGRD